MFRQITILLTLCSFLAACHRAPRYIEPPLREPQHPKEIQRERRIRLCLPEDFSVSPFPPLTAEERAQEWGKEYTIALAFAEDFDLYRAITGFKRALCLLPANACERRLEIEYAIALAYFLGKKYVEVVYMVESTDLALVDSEFPAFSDLLLILYDSYEQTGKCQQAAHILRMIEEDDPCCAQKLTLLQAIKAADLEEIPYENIVSAYQQRCKSVRKAEMLNATLPGAGYWYVGQKQTAVTAFLVNSLFIASTAALFANGHYAPGAIMLSLEGGWYFGGIYGAGLAAKEYNEHLYCNYASKITQREQLYPAMMLKFTF